MTAPPPVRPSAVLLLRVWVEGEALRARLLEPVDEQGPELTVRVTDGVGATTDAVRRWLDGVIGQPRKDPRAP